MLRFRQIATAVLLALCCCFVSVTHCFPVSIHASAATDPSAYVNETICLLNDFRKENGLAPLQTAPALLTASNLRANEITTFYSHNRPDGSSWFTTLRDVGLNTTDCSAGENIAAGFPTPALVMEGWENSEHHREAMLDPVYTYVAVGYAHYENDPERYCDYWEMLLYTTNAPISNGYAVTSTTTQATTTTTTTTTTTMTTTVTTTTMEDTLLIGDVDLDGRRSLVDWVLLNKYIMGTMQLSDIQLYLADCDQDGTVGDTDCTLLLQFLLKQISTLP